MWPHQTIRNTSNADHLLQRGLRSVLDLFIRLTQRREIKPRASVWQWQSAHGAMSFGNSRLNQMSGKSDTCRSETR
jgi:hypothetical protein